VAAQRDYYRVLGVPRDADAGAIKDAFRRLARRYHPPTPAPSRTLRSGSRKIAEAYGVLSDPGGAKKRV
jgi:molecular chaperone DnaJ